jgi:hypothetical protein
MRSTALSIFVFITTQLFALPPEPPGDYPSWVLVEIGEYYYENRDQAKALLYFREAIRRRGIYPDASLSQAESFYAEAQVRIYERLLRDAEDGYRNLVIPDTIFDIYYRMAASKQRFFGFETPEERERDWKRYLDLILEEDPFFQSLSNPNAQGAMNLSLYTLEALQDRSGELLGDIDRVLLLYEGGNPLAIPAHEIYASYYLEEENYPMAMNHSLFAIVSTFTVVREEFRTKNPAFSFAGLEDFLQQLGNDQILYTEIYDFLQYTRLIEQLIILAQAVDAMPHPISQSVRENSATILYSEKEQVYLALVEKVKLLWDSLPQIRGNAQPAMLRDFSYD